MVRVELGVASVDAVAEDLVSSKVGGNVFLWSDRSAKSSEGTNDEDSTTVVRSETGHTYIKNHPMKTKILLNQLVASLQTAVL